MGNQIVKLTCYKCNIEYNKICNKSLTTDYIFDDDSIIFNYCSEENIHCDQCCSTFCPNCEKHCCHCFKSYILEKNMIHCQKCHKEHNLHYCCFCHTQYKDVTNHCCNCKIETNINCEKHCCICCCNHRLDYCCICKKRWNIKIEEHCCKCKITYGRYSLHKCHNSSESLPTHLSSEYDKISDI